MARIALSRCITPEEIARYETDGATVIRGVVADAWLEIMRAAIQRALDDPGDAAVEYTPAGRPGRYYGDFFLWRRDPDFHAFIAESPMVELAAQVMGSARVNVFYDQLLVKEPGTQEPTPLHQDIPYWPVRGSQVVSIWVPFDRATAETGVVKYIRGSHLWGKTFAPQAFGERSGFAEVFARGDMQPLPTLDEVLAAHEAISWTVDPGDVIIHHPLILHFSDGNTSSELRRRALALRYTGDDALFDSRPGTFTQMPKIKALLPELDLKDGQPMGGPVFPQVWPRRPAGH